MGNNRTRHGGTDSGTVNNGIIEKNYSLLISKYIKDRLDALGVENSLTRTDDELLDQETRPKKAQSFYGDGQDVIILSNHLNAGGGDGAEIIYALRNSDTLSKIVATELENAGQNVRKYYQRRLPSNPAKDYYYIHRNTPNNETIIVEYGFTDSNGDDVNQIKNDWQELAEAVVRGLANYIGVPYFVSSKEYYIVKKGDTLWSIAKKYGLTVDELKDINKLTSNLLNVGQKLSVKTNVTNNQYIVKKGDTLWNIAKMYNTTVDDIKKENQLSSNNLGVGKVLLIPKKSGNNNNYIVKKGDTLYMIAKSNNTTVDSIKKINNLSTNFLTIGQQLIIP